MNKKLIKKVIIGTVLIASVFGVLILGNINKEKEEKTALEVMTEPVVTSDTVDTAIKASGKLKVKDSCINCVSSTIDGNIKEIKVEDGQYVNKGTALLLIKRYTDEEYDIEYSALRKKIQQDGDALNELSASIDLKNNELTNLDKSSSEEQKDAIDNELVSLRADYNKIVDSENNENEQINTLIKQQNLVIYSECSGNVIFNKELIKGTRVSANEPIINIYAMNDIKNFYVEAEVEYNDCLNINTGDPVSISIPDISSQEINGSIMQNGIMSYEKNGSTFCNVKIKLADNSKLPNIKLNMPVDVYIQSKVKIASVGKDNSATGSYYILPIQALVKRDNKNVVFLYSESEKSNDHIAKLVEVNVVFSNNKNIIIRSNQIDSHSIVITEGNYELNGGETVTLKKDGQGNLNLNLFK